VIAGTSRIAISREIICKKEWQGKAGLETYGPIAWEARGVGNGDDLNVVKALAEDDGERITLENHAAGSVQVRRANAWCLLHQSISCPQFQIEPQCGGMALFPKPVECGFRFRLSFRV
jgi:hypothetical protein